MKRQVVSEKQASEAYGNRIFAGIIDIILWFALFIVAALLFGKTQTTTYGHSKSTNTSLTGLPFIIFVLTELAYFVILEWLLGDTFGKLMVGVHVVSKDGERITLKQSFIRNALRAVDAFPYVIPYVVGLIVIAGDTRKRRLGDKVANTQVILEKGYKRANNWDNLS